MNSELKDLLPKIDNWLKCDEFSHFMIGITGNIQQRDPQYGAGWQLFPIAEGNHNAIINEEGNLINHYVNHTDPVIRNKCKNSPYSGGQGNVSEADTLYIAVEHNCTTTPIAEIQVPFNDIVPIKFEG